VSSGHPTRPSDQQEVAWRQEWKEKADLLAKRIEELESQISALEVKTGSASEVERLKATRDALQRQLADAQKVLASSPPPPDTSLAPNEVRITRQDFGEDWPFTVDEGILAFRATGELSTGEQVGAVTFTVNGKTYGVNGIAMGHKQYADITAIWAPHPTIKGARKNIGPVIDRGLRLRK
jgi:hypothetical protein